MTSQALLYRAKPSPIGQGCVPTQTPFLRRNLYGVGQNLREDVPDKLKWGSRNPVSALLAFSCEGLIYDEGHANHI